MYTPKMKLTPEESAILKGEKGEVLQKAMESIVRYGDIYGAECLADINAPTHLVTSFGIPMLKPVFSIMDKLINAGIKILPFTVNPRPIDYQNIKCSLLEKLVFKIMYGKQSDYEAQLKSIGLKDDNAFTCACYFDEVGNIPKYGEPLTWAESSAVIYANSVLGARCNRNSGVIELLGGVLKKAPVFGFLTDEGRKADYIIEVKTSTLPPAPVLGSCIGMKVMEKVPYIKGLDTFLGKDLNATVKDYFKDMGAALASNGAVGLFHVENLTPEAAKGAAKIRDNAEVFVVTDETISQTVKDYPVIWKNPNSKPKMCFIGCPHLSLSQLKEWTLKLEDSLKKNKRSKLAIRTIFSSSPDTILLFKKTEEYSRFIKTGAKLTYICALMYMNNPLCRKKPVVTNSNKLRTYTTAKYYTDPDILNIITGGK
ncbi:MAG: aconitase X catalytic domain-containing protein [Leptospirales bacterium]|nr:aconitase X catalytic domain-containing protein [Leptospirales bacterium]